MIPSARPLIAGVSEVAGEGGMVPVSAGAFGAACAPGASARRQAAAQRDEEGSAQAAGHLSLGGFAHRQVFLSAMRPEALARGTNSAVGVWASMRERALLDPLSLRSMPVVFTGSAQGQLTTGPSFRRSDNRRPHPGCSYSSVPLAPRMIENMFPVTGDVTATV